MLRCPIGRPSTIAGTPNPDERLRRRRSIGLSAESKIKVRYEMPPLPIMRLIHSFILSIPGGAETLNVARSL